MWQNLLNTFLERAIRQGRLTVNYADGTVHTFGGAPGGPKVEIMISDPDLPRKIIMDLELAVCEAYMDERLTIVDDDLYGLLTLGLINLPKAGPAWWQRPVTMARQAMRRVAQFNPVGKAQANVAHHYDLSARLYDLFLDADRQYSCAYFADPAMTLEEAQAAKKAHIADKLLIEPGMKVLDIGCGWGGMALTLARDYGAQVVGVTLSREQHAIAVQRAKDAGLEAQIDFRLQDYRHVNEQFDRIVSVGMFEHVGAPHYREYFRHVREFLKEDGIALIHTIGRTTPPGTTNGFITKYIFPGGYVPAMSEAMAAVEKEDLVATDVEVWRLHYAETLKHWYDRFMANADAAREIYDDRFVRMWRLYLVASELTFRLNGQVVFQFQLSRDQEAVPLTRDYLYRPDAMSQDRAHATAAQ
ncbi:class I SAM-dependent methyltransferase [Pseudooceanicola sediminis]|uniref:Class I SAM-dependent methyltransferase n=1 Tax=Pseudooceanicola sediminis TaxID=2211117 RepID=A0A399J3V5_9RHOB|nr:cyclopropane-fatty-acyl-phospholipid synthase family protein [Pseudooceanicola sediminis]KAA2314190.1 class I SAM-dependent methyltransferase [Puniceibacterium sp. HSS470]RII39951.1 class I SAM-dependent methyltransferase [Pseudooceanicola sediminis]|tara:strand:- start:1207 stop:2451 length:1245 start_codon:yes stop_codon:yes gene_type:complete